MLMLSASTESITLDIFVVFFFFFLPELQSCVKGSPVYALWLTFVDILEDVNK